MTGKLIYNDEAQYELHTNSGEIFNITKALDNVYYSDINACGVSIFYNGRKIIDRFGTLLRKQYEDRLYDYHIDDIDVDNILFYLVDAVIDFEFITRNEDAYGTQICNS